MAGNFDPVTGTVIQQFELGDIVVAPGELTDVKWEQFSSVANTIADSETGAGMVLGRQIDGRVIVPVHGYYFDNQVKIRDALSSLGIVYSIFGHVPVAYNNVSESTLNRYVEQVAGWTAAHTEFESAYLERIFVGDDPNAAAQYITSRSFSNVFARIYTGLDSHLAEVCADNLYTRVAFVANTCRGSRAHLLSGFVHFGNPIKNPDERRQQSQWGISLAAFYGMMLERRGNSEFGFNERGAKLARRVLDEIVVS
ncbi:MAG TPA: hypothetical protein VLG47_05330 [Candidatus Saccharimonadales bacterium]|nr:hypothetical protein [Candidatus Saccharimonadales bacterium]